MKSSFIYLFEFIDLNREYARKKGMTPIISQPSNSLKNNPEFDKHLYKIRHLVDNLFAKLKHFRSIGTRFEKLARNFKVIVFIANTFNLA